jgi:hypothetical protein
MFRLFCWVSSRRKSPLGYSDILAADVPHQMRGRGFRMNEWLRDRLRPRWLRLSRKGDGSADQCVDAPAREDAPPHP